MGGGISVPLLCLVWGGFLPLIVTFHQEFSGEHKTESSQRVNTGLTVKFIYEETLAQIVKWLRITIQTINVYEMLKLMKCLKSDLKGMLLLER